MRFIRSFFNAALRSMTFQDTQRPPQHQYRLNLLRAILIANIVVTLIFMSYGFYGWSVDAFELVVNRLVTLLVFPGIFILVSLFALWYTRNGEIGSVAHLVVVSGWGTCVVAAYFSGGIYASAMLGVFFYLLLGTLLLDIRQSAQLYGATVAVILALYAIELAGYLPVVPLRDLPFRVLVLLAVATQFFLMVWYHVYAVRQSERLLNSAEVRAERYRVQQELTQNIAHDLRTPITVLTNNAYLIKRKAEQGLPVEQHVARLDAQAQMISKMISDLALLTDLDSDPLHETHTPFRLAEQLHQVVEACHTYAASRDITITLVDDTDGKATIHGDKPQIERVFENLVENAIHYGRKGGQVNLWIRGVDGRNEIAIDIRDDGIGIAPEHHEKVFERFYRVDTARGSHRQQSTGIGLYIVRRIVERHGGRIALTSTPALGSTFTVYLPCRQRQRVPTPAVRRG